MQWVWLVTRFFGKVLAGCIALTWASNKVIPELPYGGSTARVLVSYTLSFAIFYIIEAFIYPNYFSPFRHLPRVQGGYDPRLIWERPRGKTPLKWMKKHPDADILNSFGKRGQCILFPVSPEALRDVLSTNAYDFVKPIGLWAYLETILGKGLINLEGSLHKQQRKLLTPVFNVKHIRALYPVMWNKAGLLLDRLEEETEKAGNIEITYWASRYALDIIGRAGLSKDFNALTTTEEHPLSQAFATLLEPELYLVLYMVFMLGFPPKIIKMLPFKAGAVMKRESKVIHGITADLLDEKLEEMKEKDGKVVDDNILGKILTTLNVERSQTIDHMKTFIGAGHETSASSISWAAHLLTLPENLHYQKLLREEIRSVIPTVENPDGSHSADFDASEASLQSAIETLPYLNGICEEVLRLFPPVPATLRDCINDTSIAGTSVPRGTMIVIMPWAINRNPKFWGEEADKMRPERWIDRAADGSLRANKNGGAVSNYCETTFLHGAHSCIGRDFAKSELKCAIASIYGRFEVRRLEGDDGSKVRITGAVTTKPQGGLRLRLTRVPGF